MGSGPCAPVTDINSQFFFSRNHTVSDYTPGATDKLSLGPTQVEVDSNRSQLHS